MSFKPQLIFPPHFQPSKLSDGLVQQFLLPDQTPPILEAEMSLRAEQLNNNKQIRCSSAHSDGGTSSQFCKTTPASDNKAETKRDMESPKPKEQQEKRATVKSKETEERQEPEGRQADTSITEQVRKEVCLF